MSCNNIPATVPCVDFYADSDSNAQHEAFAEWLATISAKNKLFFYVDVWNTIINICHPQVDTCASTYINIVCQLVVVTCFASLLGYWRKLM